MEDTVPAKQKPNLDRAGSNLQAAHDDYCRGAAETLPRVRESANVAPCPYSSTCSPWTTCSCPIAKPTSEKACLPPYTASACITTVWYSVRASSHACERELREQMREMCTQLVSAVNG